MKKDFIITFSTQLIVLFSGLVVFKLAIIQFGNIGFSEFSLVKRNIAYVYTLLLVGLGVAVPRYMAKEIGEKSGEEDSVFFAAVFIVFISFLTISLFFLVFQTEITFLLFGNKAFVKFIIPLLFSLVGLSLHGLVYAYYRGKMFFKNANLLQVVNMGINPLLAFLFANSTEEIFLYTGLLMCVVSLPVLIYILIARQFSVKRIKYFIAILIKYGFQRLPADFGMASLIALPAIFAAHTEGAVVAGYVAFSMSLLSLSGQTVAPVGLIMLPKISHLLGEKNFILIRVYVQKLFILAMGISFLGALLYQVFAKEILRIYLSNISEELVSISKQIMWGALFYPFYVTMRSVVDAYHVLAYNTVSIFFSLGTFLLVYACSYDIYFSLILALIVLAGMTFYFIGPLLILYKVEK